MKGWNDCPRCWGTGLVGGFSVTCDLKPPNNSSVEVVFRDFKLNPLTRAEVITLLGEIEDELEHVQNADHDDVLKAAARVVVRTLLRTMRLKVVDRG